MVRTLNDRRIDVEVGARVRARRLMMGMSQGELGRRAGVSFQQIQKYEKGINRIGASRLSEFATVLEVPASYFFNEPGAEAETNDMRTFLASRQGLALARNFMRIDDEKIRQVVIDFVGSIAEQS